MDSQHKVPVWRKIFGSYTKEQREHLSEGAKKLASFLSLFWLVVVVTVLRSSIIEPYRIPTPSMVPTLMVGDHIFVNKFSYGLKLPWPLSDGGLIDKKVFLVEREGPKAGDVIVFEYPRDPSINFIKRVVGVPGDRLYLRNNMLYVNGQESAQSELQDPVKLAELKTFFSNPDLVTIKNESLGGRDHMVAFDQAMGAPIFADFPQAEPEIVVPANSYFMMGDNRNNSSDSRFWGFVRREAVKGRAMVIWFSLHLDWRDFLDPATWTVVFTPRRIGTLVR